MIYASEIKSFMGVGTYFISVFPLQSILHLLLQLYKLIRTI